MAKRGHAARRARRHAAAPAAVLPVVLSLQAGEGEPRPLTADLTAGQWRQRAPLLPAQRRRQGQLPRDLRQMITAMLWIERTTCSWRALPSHFGPWQDVYAHYHRWRQDGRWVRIRQTVQPITSEAACA